MILKSEDFELSQQRKNMSSYLLLTYNRPVEMRKILGGAGRLLKNVGKPG